MRNKENTVELERVKLKESIRYYEDSRKVIARELAGIIDQYKKGVDEEHSSQLSEEARKRVEWLHLCNSYIEKKKGLLKDYNDKARLKVYNNVKILLPLSIILILLVTLGIF